MNSNRNKGILLVQYQGKWGTVCDDGFGQKEADTACRAMKYRAARSYKSFSQEKNSFNANSGDIILDDVKCSSTEKSLFDCKSRKWGESNCNHNEDIVLECIK